MLPLSLTENQADLTAERQAHAANQARLEAGRAELEAAGRRLTEPRPPFSTELVRRPGRGADGTGGRTAPGRARRGGSRAGAPAADRIAPAARAGTGRRSVDPVPTDSEAPNKKPADEHGAPTNSNPEDGSESSDNHDDNKTERAAAIRWIQDQMADYDLTTERPDDGGTAGGRVL